ncbi:hypothetical protein JG688_00008065 [Phytophthora aleatoria]|uniref:Translin-associated factor X-interacting protein 1 N-terminal domain-containing protein n=1 Tax=Phytophthora aleatoria TaxID=2496075 RepID=A0A8J5INU0_9STRA|nr:hypothetical protein JG688_00008065 [Phytophthora aleatoria]
MDFVSIGLASPSPRRPPQSKGSASTNSTLPPLLPTSEFAPSPRKKANEVSSKVNHFNVDKPRPIQVASWPVTFAPGSPKRAQLESPIDLDSFSPISPKVRKVHTRTRLLDDSRTRPALLQELLDFLHSELDGQREDSTPSKPSLRRLQVVREALNRLIDGFSVYAPVLMRIRDEYEHAVEALHARSLMVPGLQTRLQSVETHCLRQLSACSAEAKACSLTLKRRLAETQALLAASAAENARLTAALKVEKENVTKAESKLTEVQRSTLTLASSVRRHDESLRAGQERSLVDARALQKVTARYYHACDELAELKKTVAALEEQGNGEHVAADKNTILLLSREAQELSAALAASSCTTNSNQDGDNKHVALNQAFITGLDGLGLEFELSDLLGAISTASTIPEGIDATAAMITQRLRQKLQQFSLLAAKSEDQQGPVIFLTEPGELLTLHGDTAAQLVTSSVLNTKSSGDFIAGRGMSSDIPTFLQFDGIVRNFFFPRTKIEQFVGQIWDQFDEQIRAAHNRNSTTRGLASGNDAITALSSAGASLTMALERFLQRSRDNREDRVELVYNFLDGLERYSAQSSVCRLFHLVFTQELPIDARSDQTRELTKLHEALVVVDRDRHFSNSSELADSVTNSLPPGRVLLADVVRTLGLTFPWKSDAELSQLHRALIVDLRGQSQVDYTALLSHHSHVTNTVKSGIQVKWQFAECLKMQRLDDLLTFRRHIQDQIRRFVLPGDESTELPADTETLMISLRDVRACLYTADSALSEADICRILAAMSGLSAQELLTHDDMMLDARQILQRLPTLLLRPTGRFKDSTFQ